MDEKKILKLTTPIQFGTEVIEQLEFRGIEPEDIYEWKIGERPTIGQAMFVAARLCGKPLPLLKKLSFADTMEVQNIMGEALESGLATGKKS